MAPATCLGRYLPGLRLDLEKLGAGEGIRTLDPNLGKVIIGLR